MENKDIERIRSAAYQQGTDSNYALFTTGFISGAQYEHAHLQTEIQRLKGLIEEAWKDAFNAGYSADYMPNEGIETFEQFKQKHGL